MLRSSASFLLSCISIDTLGPVNVTSFRDLQSEDPAEGKLLSDERSNHLCRALVLNVPAAFHLINHLHDSRIQESFQAHLMKERTEMVTKKTSLLPL